MGMGMGKGKGKGKAPRPSRQGSSESRSTEVLLYAQAYTKQGSSTIRLLLVDI
jgi:hypothetical protein